MFPTQTESLFTPASHREAVFDRPIVLVHPLTSARRRLGKLLRFLPYSFMNVLLHLNFPRVHIIVDFEGNVLSELSQSLPSKCVVHATQAVIAY